MLYLNEHNAYYIRIRMLNVYTTSDSCRRIVQDISSHPETVQFIVEYLKI